MRLTRLIFVCLIAGILSSCGAPADLDRAKTLHRGLTGDPESLDVHLFSSVQATTVLRDIREGLVTLSRDGSIAGGVASDWETSADGKIIKFQLRNDARWSDGRTITARDFVASFRRLVDPQTASPYASFVESIDGAREIIAGKAPIDELGVFARSDYLLEVKLARKSPYFIQLLLHPSTFPLYSEVDPDSGNANSFSVNLEMTNGAYKVDERRVNSFIRLSRDSEYWNDGNTSIDVVIYHVVDQKSEFPRFRAGELDITNNVSKEAFNYYSQKDPDSLKISSMLGVYYYGYNLARHPFDNDLDLRAALSLAIDRRVITDEILGRGEIPAYSWIPPGTANYSSASDGLKDIKDEARRQLAVEHFRRSKFAEEKPLQVELRFNSGGGHDRIAVAIQAMWREVLGVEAVLVAEEFKVFLANVRQMSDTEIFRLSWTADFNDPYAFLSLFESGNPSNLTGYRNAELDKLLRDAQEQNNLDYRAALLGSAEQLIIDDHPAIPLYFYVSKHLVARRVVGWTENVLDIHYSHHLQLVDEPSQD